MPVKYSNSCVRNWPGLNRHYLDGALVIISDGRARRTCIEFLNVKNSANSQVAFVEQIGAKSVRSKCGGGTGGAFVAEVGAMKWKSG